MTDCPSTTHLGHSGQVSFFDAREEPIVIENCLFETDSFRSELQASCKRSVSQFLQSIHHLQSSQFGNSTFIHSINFSMNAFNRVIVGDDYYYTIPDTVYSAILKSPKLLPRWPSYGWFANQVNWWKVTKAKLLWLCTCRILTLEL